MLRAQLAAAGAEEEGTIHLVYMEGRTIYYVLPAAASRTHCAQLEQLEQQLLRELGFAPVLEELALS
jgi:hypothetical protein